MMSALPTPPFEPPHSGAYGGPLGSPNRSGGDHENEATDPILAAGPAAGQHLGFGALRRELPDISEKMLIQTLRLLEENELILRHDFKLGTM